jgi:hypothetical protein
MRKIISLIIMLAILLSIALAISQSASAAIKPIAGDDAFVKGKVINQQTGEPIELALVIFDGLHQDNTDANGDFLLPIPSNRALGFGVFKTDFIPILNVNVPALQPGEVYELSNPIEMIPWSIFYLGSLNLQSLSL